MTIFPFSDDHDFSPNPSFNFSCAARSPLTSKFLQIISLFIKKNACTGKKWRRTKFKSQSYAEYFFHGTVNKWSKLSHVKVIRSQLDSSIADSIADSIGHPDLNQKCTSCYCHIGFWTCA